MKTPESDPRVKRTRHSLRHALMELIVEKDFSSLTVQNVTDRAGIHRSTFYLHYTGLPALLEDCTRTLFNDMRADIYATTNAQQTSSQLEPIVARVFYHLEQHRNFYHVMLGKHGSPVFQELFQKMLMEFIFEPPTNDETVEHIPLPMEMLVEFYISGFYGIASWWLEKKMPISAEQVSQHFVRDILLAYFQLTRRYRREPIVYRQKY